MKILVIEDDKKFASFLKRALKETGAVVDIAFEGENAVYLAENNTYDLIVLDVILPKKDGFSICRGLREKGINVPVLMLTAKNSLEDKVAGLDSGADDYLSKPFALKEFLARVRALLRRNLPDKGHVIKVADLEIDQISHVVKRAGEEITLTSKEYALLEYLMVNSGKVVTRTMITEHVWEEDFDSFTNVVDVYINFVRKKVDEGFPRTLIHTVRGVGYILKE